MPSFRRKPLPVLAFQFNGEAQADWPNWIKSHKVFGVMGEQSPSLQLGIMKLPTRNNSISVGVGTWAVLEGYEVDASGKPVGGVLGAYSADDFAANFEEADDQAEA